MKVKNVVLTEVTTFYAFITNASEYDATCVRVMCNDIQGGPAKVRPNLHF